MDEKIVSTRSRLHNFRIFGNEAEQLNQESLQIPSFRPMKTLIFRSPDKLFGSFRVITAARVHFHDNLTPGSTYSPAAISENASG